MLISTYEEHKEKNAFVYTIKDQEFKVSYEKFFDDILILSRAFKAKGIKKGAKVMLVSDNRYEWIVSDFALVSLGAISVPRGCDTPTQELDFIINHAECEYLIVENQATYEKHKELIKTLKLKAVFIIEAENIHTLFDKVYSYNDLLDDRTISPKEIEDFCALRENIYLEDTFTLIYTSGTTGQPKGVILTHQNIMYNVKVLPKIIALQSDDLWVSILPSWHIFERACEYLSISQGCCIVYSSIKTFGADLEHYKPTLVATVPRLWESMYTKINTTLEKQDPKKAKIFNKLVKISSIYRYNKRIIDDELPRFQQKDIRFFAKQIMATCKVVLLYPLYLFAQKKLLKVQEKFGGRLRLAISGGGALPGYLERWIDAVGIRIVNAYGMTECAPAIAGRALNCNTFNTLGKAVEGTDLRIIDEYGEDVDIGVVGEILVKGDQVTPGYYKDEEENKKSFDKEGYFYTGDLGKLTIKDELIITGRSKEIIVLANGENVDPSRIEGVLSMLPFVEDTILVGQDKKGLGLLVVPDFDKLQEYVANNFNKVVHNVEHLLEDKPLVNRLKSDMNKLLHQKEGFKPFEKLQNIHFLEEGFKPGLELTNTLKKKRHIIEKKYKALIDKILH